MDKETIVQLLSDGVISNEVAAKYFPELKENEDEKIRKELIVFIKGQEKVSSLETSVYQSWIAWLKKKGEKTEPIEGFNTEFERQVSHLIASAINKEYEYTKDFVKWTSNALLNYAKHELEKQGEQKAYTLEQATNIFLDALSDTPYNNKPITDAQVIAKELLNFLSDDSYYSYNPNAINEQNPAWSEEDIFKVQRICKYLEEVKMYYVDITEVRECMDWLKSLKSKNAWKPSKEQIIALRWILNNIPYNKHKEEISGLLDQINELREDL